LNLPVGSADWDMESREWWPGKMAGIRRVDPDKHQAEAEALLHGVQERLGMTPKMMKVMAASPAVLGGYLSLSVALTGGTLDPKFREQIGLAVAQANNSDYCLSRHTVNAKKMGLTEAEIAAARQSRSDDPKRDAGLKFAMKLVIFRGQVNDADLARVRAAGYSDAEIVEVVANVAFYIFANYFNHVAEQEVQSS
jgi:uncharacterized peroxidase-related enzyme